jgi:hypothetical protein
MLNKLKQLEAQTLQQVSSKPLNPTYHTRYPFNINHQGLHFYFREENTRLKIEKDFLQGDRTVSLITQQEPLGEDPLISTSELSSLLGLRSLIKEQTTKEEGLLYLVGNQPATAEDRTNYITGVLAQIQAYQTRNNHPPLHIYLFTSFSSQNTQPGEKNLLQETQDTLTSHGFNSIKITGYPSWVFARSNGAIQENVFDPLSVV